MEFQTKQNVRDFSDLPFRKLVDKSNDIKIAMLSTMSADGCLHSRPMYTQEIKEDGSAT